MKEQNQTEGFALFLVYFNKPVDRMKSAFKIVSRPNACMEIPRFIPSVTFRLPQTIAGRWQRAFTERWREMEKIPLLMGEARAAFEGHLCAEDTVPLHSKTLRPISPDELEVALAIAGGRLSSDAMLTYNQASVSCEEVAAHLSRTFWRGRILKRVDAEETFEVLHRSCPDTVAGLGACMRLKDDSPVLCVTIRQSGESLIAFYKEFIRRALGRDVAPYLPPYWEHRGTERSYDTLLENAVVIPIPDQTGDIKPAEMKFSFPHPVGGFLASEIRKGMDELRENAGLVITDVDTRWSGQIIIR